MTAPTPPKTAIEPTLYMLGPYWDLPSISPFCVKLATWLRVVGLPHRTVIQEDPRKGPKRKSPWIVDHGRVLGDSEFIIEYLKRTYGVDPDAHLDPHQRAISLTLHRTFEEHFHQITDHVLFVLDAGWEQSRAHFDFLPAILRPLILPLIRSDFKKTSHLRGIGRHSEAEIAIKAKADLQAAATFLGDKPYVFGDEPTTVDCTLYGFLSNTLWAPIPSAAKTALQGHENLVAFCERMRARYWSPDYDTESAHRSGGHSTNSPEPTVEPRPRVVV